ncbi:MAG: C40 family peptidase [Phycisphaerae bacterium]|nr:C40 family peptidase [Saprospiraceae bacterium]
MNTARLLLVIPTILFAIACTPPKSSPKSSPKPRPKSAPYTEAVATPFRTKVVEYGKKFVGTTYKYAGQSPKTGFDCSGFTSYVLKEFGVMASPASNIQATEGRYVALEKVMPGDLIFFGESKNKISHVALVVKRGSGGIICVHSTTSRGVIVENVTQSAYWKPKILFARDVISDD